MRERKTETETDRGTDRYQERQRQMGDRETELFNVAIVGRGTKRSNGFLLHKSFL